MLNQLEIKNQLFKWLEDFVEKPNPMLSGWAPCPYARQARIKNEISIYFSIPSDFNLSVNDAIILLETFSVVVICFDHTLISAHGLQLWVKDKNNELMQNNYIILEDHPDAVEHVANVKMNFGLCGLLVIQKLDKLTFASNQLKEKGYYECWERSAFNEVVSWRKN